MTLVGVNCLRPLIGTWRRNLRSPGVQPIVGAHVTSPFGQSSHLQYKSAITESRFFCRGADAVPPLWHLAAAAAVTVGPLTAYSRRTHILPVVLAGPLHIESPHPCCVRSGDHLVQVALVTRVLRHDTDYLACPGSFVCH